MIPKLFLKCINLGIIVERNLVSFVHAMCQLKMKSIFCVTLALILCKLTDATALEKVS